MSIVEAIVVTVYTGWEWYAEDIEAYASVIDFSDGVIPDEAKMPGKFTFTFLRYDLGKEWITGPTPARFVGVQSPEYAMWLSSFTVLGTPYCTYIHKLAQNDAIPKYEQPVTVTVGGSYTKVLDITTTSNIGEDRVKYGSQYQKCIGLTVTLEDGVTPAPAFVNFDQATRTLKVNPKINDVGLHHLQVNYDYLFNLDQNQTLETHEHSVPLTIEVIEFDLTKYSIPANESEDMNKTHPVNNTSNKNVTLSEELLELLEELTKEDEEVEAPNGVSMSITSISQQGHVIIDFDSFVLVPSNYTDLPPSIFDVWYKCNSFDPVALAQNFTYNLTSFSPTQIEIDLFFSAPYYVSAGSEMFDEVVVRLDKTFFGTSLAQKRYLKWIYNDTSSNDTLSNDTLSNDALSRDDFYELTHPIYPLIPDKTEANVLNALATVAAASLFFTFVIPLALQIIIKTAMSKVWYVFNTFQILTLMPIMDLNLPANVQVVYDEFSKITHLEFIPKDRIYEYLFGESETEVDGAFIKDHILAKAGFSKDNMGKNIFLIVLSLIFLALLIGLVLLIRKVCYHRLPEKVQKALNSLKHKLMFNSILRYLLQTYLTLGVSSFISLSYSTAGTGYASGIALLIFLVISPICVICILWRQKHPLAHPFYKVRMGSLYLDVDTVDKPFALLFTPLFCVRRFVFALIAVVSENHLVQLFVTIYASLVLIFFYVTVWPMNDKVNNLMQLCNELFLLTCIHFMFAFTDYTVDPVKRFKIGFAYLIFIGVNIAVNIVLIGRTLVK